MIHLNYITSVLISNANGLNTPVKKQGYSDWKKGDPTICAKKK